MTTERELPAGVRINDVGERTLVGRFEGRTIIVTGAASGIGRATALRLAREGARVVAGDLSAEGLAALAASETGGEIVGVAGNVTGQADVDALVAACGGVLHGVVNNAGIMDGFEPAGEVTDETFERQLAVNLWGTLRVTRAALPLLRASGGGSIVNLASMAGLGGGFGGVAYTSAKHAVVGLTKNTAIMYAAEGIRCNAIAPGAVITGIEKNVGSELGARTLGPIMRATMPSLATPEALAAGITFLLSDDAANTTGAVLTSDGGWAAI